MLCREGLEEVAAEEEEGGAPVAEIPASSLEPWDTPLTRIDLSRHQICDDGAVALGLALRHNIRVEVGKLGRVGG